MSRYDVTATPDPTLIRGRLERLWSSRYSHDLGAKFDRFYLQNPAGPARVSLLHCSDRSEAIGSAAVFPRTLSIRGTVARAGIAGDLFVSPEHRTGGPAILLLRQAIEAVENGELDLLYAIPNRAAEPLFRRIGYRAVSDRVRWLLVLDVRSYVDRLPLGRVWGPVAAGVMRVRLGWARRFRRQPLGLGVETGSSIDEQYDRLWERARQGFGVVGDRTSRYLRWRFQGGGDEDNQVIAWHSPGGALHAYAVVVQRERVLDVRDLVWTGDEPPSALLRAVAEYGRVLGCDTVRLTVLPRGDLASMLPRLGFLPRPDETRLYVYARRELWDRFPCLHASNSWLFCSGDDDT